MTTLGATDWLARVKPFERAAKLLGIALSDLAESEDVEQIRYSTERFSGRDLLQQDVQVLKATLHELTEIYGDALHLQFQLADQSILQVGSDGLDAQLQVLLEKLNREIEPTFSLSLDKSRWLAAQYPSEQYPGVLVRVFFFTDALQRALSYPATALEAEGGLWHSGNDATRLIILIPEHEIKLTGERLVILGGNALQELGAFLDQPELSSNELITRMRKKVLEPVSPVKWVYFKLNHLTPLHLCACGCAESNDPIALALYTQLMNLSLIYLADRTKGPAAREGNEHTEKVTEWRTTFTEQGHTVDIVWNASAHIPVAGNMPWACPLAWCEIVSFAYSDNTYAFDRLKIIQYVIAHSLEGIGPELGYSEILSPERRLIEQIHSSWENFIEGKIKEYFGQLRDIEQAVDAYTEKVQSQFDTLTRSLSDNVLTAVGVLIGTFITAAFREQFGVALFWIITIVYLAYLLIFPHGLGLKASHERFYITTLAFEKRRKNFINRLSAKVVNDIVGDVQEQWQERFNAWFSLAQRTYRIVAGALLMIAIIVTLVASINNKDSQKDSVTTTPGLTPSSVQLILTETPSNPPASTNTTATTPIKIIPSTPTIMATIQLAITPSVSSNP
jgi:hypothetical protein